MGRCERLDGEEVMTRFFFLGPFFVPLDSVYLTRFSGKRVALPVRRNTKSIAFAYFRWLAGPVILFVTFLASRTEADGPPQLSNASKVTLAIMVAAWLGFVFIAGRTWGREARQRRMLSACVGHGAPPELLFTGATRLVVDDLERSWDKLLATVSYRSSAKAGGSWKEVYPHEVPKNLLALYYALCRYQAAASEEEDEQEAMTTRARFVWDRIEQQLAQGQRIGGAAYGNLLKVAPLSDRVPRTGPFDTSTSVGSRPVAADADGAVDAA